jgi:hypothetical protein
MFYMSFVLKPSGGVDFSRAQPRCRTSSNKGLFENERHAEPIKTRDPRALSGGQTYPRTIAAG